MTAPSTDDTLATINAFNDALNRHDIDAVMALMTDDCVFENTWPAPDGERYEGQAAVRAFWERLIAGSPSAHFDLEELFADGDRATQRWRYTWVDDQGQHRSHPWRRCLPCPRRQGCRETRLCEGLNFPPAVCSCYPSSETRDHDRPSPPSRRHRRRRSLPTHGRSRTKSAPDPDPVQRLIHPQESPRSPDRVRVSRWLLAAVPVLPEQSRPPRPRQRVWRYSPASRLPPVWGSG